MHFTPDPFTPQEPQVMLGGSDDAALLFAPGFASFASRRTTLPMNSPHASQKRDAAPSG